MNFTCNNCQKRYSIADEKVRGKTVKVRCKNCQNVISVEGPQLPLEESTRVVSLADVERLRAQERSLVEPDSVPPAASVPAPVASAPPLARAPAAALQTPWDDEPTRAAPLRAPASPWFVMVRNKQEGPLDEGGLRELAASGAVSGRSFFWQQGMADWKRGSDIPELAGLFAPPPAPEPPPPPPPPVEEPPPAPAPARAARGAAARREPEPQPFTPEPEPPPEEPQPQQQAWEPEQPQQQDWGSGQQEEEPPENTYYQEPAARTPASGRRQAVAPAASAAPLNDDQLFSDLDLPGNRDGGDEGGDYGRGELPPDDEDRLAAQGRDDGGEGELEAAPPRRAVKKPGVKRRTAAWKYALLALLLLLVLPVGGAYVLSDVLGIMPLRVKTVDAQGNPVERSYFSSEGAGALADKLMGRAPPAPKPAPVAPKPAPAPEKQPEPAPTEVPAGGAGAAPTGAPPTGAGTESGAAAAPAPGQQQAANADPAKKDVAPEAAPAAAAAAPLAEDLSDEEVDRVVEQAQAGFRECAEAEFRKNPSFRGGKVKLTATVGNTGTVKEAVLSRKDLRSSPVGTCLVDKAKAMVFSAFKGEDVELEIPLVLSRTM